MQIEIIMYLNSSLRLLFITMINTDTALFVTSMVLPQKKSKWEMRFYFAIKTIIQVILIEFLEKYYFINNQGFQVIKTMVILTFAVFNYVMYCRLYRGSFLKIALAAVLGDTIASFMGIFTVAIVNLMEKRADIWALADILKIGDLQLIIINVLFRYIIWKLLGTTLQKVGYAELRHKKMWWFIFWVYILSASFTTLFSHSTYSMAIFVGIVLYVLALVFSIVVINKYQTSVKKEAEYLSIKKKLIETQYESIQRQINQMKHNQYMINEQMEEINKMKDISTINQKLLEYLNQLKANYNQVKAGMYCDDGMIDAVINYYTNLFYQKNIHMKCSIVRFARGNIEEKDMVELLLVLMEYLREKIQGTSFDLYLQTIKNHLIIELIYSGGLQKKVLNNKIKHLLKKYDGNIMIEKNNDENRVIIIIKG